jgi:hypothetical protein
LRMLLQLEKRLNASSITTSVMEVPFSLWT